MQYFGKSFQNPAYLFSMAFGKVLRKLRKDRGLSQTELADLVGLRQSAIANYEGGKRNLDVETVLAFTRALGIGLEELCGQKEAEPQQGTRIHGNKREAKINELFGQLSPAHQRAFLMQMRSILATKGRK